MIWQKLGISVNALNDLPPKQSAFKVIELQSCWPAKALTKSSYNKPVMASRKLEKFSLQSLGVEKRNEYG